MKLQHWLAIHVIGLASGWLVGALLARSERFGWFLDQAPTLCAACGVLLSALLAVAIAVRNPERRRVLYVALDIPIAAVAILLLLVLRAPPSTCFSDPLRDTYTSTADLPERMQRIRAGMTRAEVLQILGEPVYKSDASEWRYSWGGRCLGESGGRSDCSCAWVYFAVEFSGDTVARPIVAWDRS